MISNDNYYSLLRSGQDTLGILGNVMAAGILTRTRQMQITEGGELYTLVS